MIETAWDVFIHHGHAEVVVRDAVNGVMIAGNQMPFFGVDVEFFGMPFQRGYCIVFRVDGMRQHQYPIVVFVFFIEPQPVFFHLGANRRAMDKEKVHHVNFTGKSGIGHRLAVLIHKTEIRNAPVNSIAGRGEVALAENGQAAFGLGAAGGKQGDREQ